MNSIFKLKYKLHHLINILFYFVFFAIGFIMGGGTIEKIISTFNSII